MSETLDDDLKINFSPNEERSVYLFVVASLVVVLLLIAIPMTVIRTDAFPVIIWTEEEKRFLTENQKWQKFSTLDDDFSVHLSVIIPAYNEEARLPSMIDECYSFLATRASEDKSFTYEIIVVNDGSKDNTFSVAMEYTKKYGSSRIRVMNLLTNRGKGGAVRLGTLAARGAVILFADADGATKFGDLVKLESLLHKMVSNDFTKHPKEVSESVAVVCGSRAHLEEEAIATRSYFRTLLMFGFHFLVKHFGVNNVKDTQCGFKLFTREAATQCFYNLHVERWAFDVELLYIANYLKIPIGEVCVTWTEIDGSKIVPVFSWLQMALDLLLIWLRHKLGIWSISLVRMKNE